MKKILFMMALATSLAQLATAQEEADKKEGKLHFMIKETGKPVVYIDGEKYPHGIVNLIDYEKIKSVTVLKDSAAQEKYDAPNGVVWITTKYDDSYMEMVNNEIKVVIRNEKKIIDESKEPMFIVDGKEMGKVSLADLDPDDIQSISVLKDEAAMKEYNAPNGVVIIKTKK